MRVLRAINKNKQRGAAILLLLMLFMVGGTVVFVSSQGPERADRRKLANDYQILQQAKQALIARAAFTQTNSRPGELPCPDINYDGTTKLNEDNNGNRCTTYRGWLPHKLLGFLEDLRDSSGARLWYAVSEQYQTFNQGVLNVETLAPGDPTALRLNGNQVVAVIIAPGEPIQGQQGNRPDKDDVKDALADSNHMNAIIESVKFLDFLNVDGDATVPDDAAARTYFTSANNSAGANDIVVGITAAEIWQLTKPAILQEVRTKLVNYTPPPLSGNLNSLPRPVKQSVACNNDFVDEAVDPDPANKGFLPVNTGCLAQDGVDMGDWYVNNNWNQYIYYVVSKECNATAGPCAGDGNQGGVLSLYQNSDSDAIVAYAGPIVASDTQCDANNNYGQSRPAPPGPMDAYVCDYLDTSENTDFDGDFEAPRLGNTVNDIVVPLDI